MTTYPTHYDVIIVGAGLSGCATARALAAADETGSRRILIIDSHKDVHPRFSGEFIHPRGTRVLDELGFGDALRQAGAIDVDGFAVFEHADADVLRLDYASVPNEIPQGLSVHHKVLVRTMRKLIRDLPSVELREGWSLHELIKDHRGHIVGVVARDPQKQSVSIQCDLVIGADGKSSATRKLAGIRDDGRETIGFTAGLEVLDARLPLPTYAHVLLGAWGPTLAYPIHRHRDGSISTRLTFDLPRDLPVKGGKVRDYLLRAYVPFLPRELGQDVAKTLRSSSRPMDMAPTVNLPATRTVLPGLALVGDAGGCSHPITASGMTMGLRDAETIGLEAKRRAHATGEPWLDVSSLQRYCAEHDRYVPTRQALADAIYEAFRGEREGSRAIRRALFQYWMSGEQARARSMALLSCAERRPSVFLSEYLKTARHALGTSLMPRHATHYPIEDRVRQARGAASLARDKLGLVAQVMWAQVRPGWLPPPSL